VSLPAAPLHYGEVDVRGAFHHAPAEVDQALALLASGALDWRALADGPIGLHALADALVAPVAEARKPVVDPSL
jgi:L-iditol 2-dehydrogenase